MKNCIYSNGKILIFLILFEEQHNFEYFIKNWEKITIVVKSDRILKKWLKTRKVTERGIFLSSIVSIYLDWQIHLSSQIYQDK